MEHPVHPQRNPYPFRRRLEVDVTRAGHPCLGQHPLKELRSPYRGFQGPTAELVRNRSPGKSTGLSRKLNKLDLDGRCLLVYSIKRLLREKDRESELKSLTQEQAENAERKTERREREERWKRVKKIILFMFDLLISSSCLLLFSPRSLRSRG